MSSFKDKMNRFIRSECKAELVKNKMMPLVCKIKYGHSFGYFGKECYIEKPLRIIGKKHIFLRRGVQIGRNARIEAITDYNGITYKPRIEIGERTTFGQNLHIGCCSEVIIGKNVTFSANIYIADVAHEYKIIGEKVLNQPLIVTPTHIGDNCFIGYGAVIHPGVILGKHCVVGSNAVVLKGKYPDYSVLAGVPAKIIRKYNAISNEWERV